jgi:hypothetical protein
VRYQYQVVAETAAGDASDPTNAIEYPGSHATPTIAEARAAVDAADAAGALTPGARDRLVALIDAAQTALDAGDTTAALDSIVQAENLVAPLPADGGVVTDDVAREDLRDVLLRVDRSTRYGKACAPAPARRH